MRKVKYVCAAGEEVLGRKICVFDADRWTLACCRYAQVPVQAGKKEKKPLTAKQKLLAKMRR